MLAKGVIARQHLTKVHVLLSILIGLGVEVLGRVLSMDREVRPVTITSSYKGSRKNRSYFFRYLLCVLNTKFRYSKSLLDDLNFAPFFPA